MSHQRILLQLIRQNFWACLPGRRTATACSGTASGCSRLPPESLPIPESLCNIKSAMKPDSPIDAARCIREPTVTSASRLSVTPFHVAYRYPKRPVPLIHEFGDPACSCSEVIWSSMCY